MCAKNLISLKDRTVLKTSSSPLLCGDKMILNSNRLTVFTTACTLLCILTHAHTNKKIYVKLWEGAIAPLAPFPISYTYAVHTLKNESSLIYQVIQVL